MFSPDPVLDGLWLLCVGLVMHSYIFYPLILAMVRQPARVNEAGVSEAGLPSVTILVAAHNEESVIAARVENALATDYPRDRLEVLIASDGSSDKTEAIVASFEDERVRLLAHHPNRGKSYTLNRAILEAQGEVIVLSDANTTFQSDAVRALVDRLCSADSPVAVCGKLVIIDPSTGNNVDGLYWRYESWIKSREGVVGSALGANGGIYAIKKDLYCTIPDNTIIDDMTIPLLMRLKHGGPVVFEDSAVATEDAPPEISDEFGRRVRIGVGAFQSLRLLWPLLMPSHGFSAFAFFSHKLLRWFTPHLLLVVLACIVVGLPHPAYQILGLFSFAFLFFAWCGTYARGDSAAARILRLATLFTSMNAALLVGFLRWLSTSQSGTWKRTARDPLN